MHFYFLRHGKAEEHTTDKPDRERHLVERGASDAEAVARLLKTLGVQPTAIYTSPYPRAAETARIVAETLGCPQLLIQRTELEAGHLSMGSLQKLASGQPSTAVLMIVGHEPDLSDLIQALCGAACEMKTAATAHVTADRVEPKHGVLHWLLPPKLLHAAVTPD